MSNNYINSKNDDLLLSKIMDKVRFCNTKNKIQTSDFLSEEEQSLVLKDLNKKKINNYILTGGYDSAERKLFLFFPEKLEDMVEKIDLNEFINVVRITLPNSLEKEYTHRNYLGALMKLGIVREKVGDIIVSNDGADILVEPEIIKFLLTSLPELTRFSKSKIENVNIEDLRKIETKTEIIKITVASLRLDNIVSELIHCSRSKANDVLYQERVLINHEVFVKPSKEVKENDVITIRGKGRFIVKEVSGISKKGRLYINIEKYI